MGSPARCRRPVAPARRSRRWAGHAARAISRRSDVRARDARARSRIRGLGRGTRRTPNAGQPPRLRRPVVGRRHRTRGAVADARLRASRATGHGHRDQQRVDRPARLRGRSSVPAHGGRRGRGRSRAAGTPWTRGLAEDCSPRQPNGVHGCLPRRRRSGGGRSVGRHRQSVWPPLPGDAVADRGQGCPPPPDGP